MSDKFDIEEVGNYSFDVDRITSEIETALITCGLPKLTNQVNLYHRPGYPVAGRAMFEDFVGSLHPEKNKTNILVSQSQFTEIHPLLAGSYTEEVCNIVRSISKLAIGRVRLLGLNPKSCYSWHVDPDEIRYHIPLKTFYEAFFVVDEGVYRMPEAGHLYTILSTKPHTAINAAFNKRRTHLVFDTYTEEQKLNNPHDFKLEQSSKIKYDVDNIY